MDFALLAAECAPWVATQTMAAIVRTESRFNPLAININAKFRLERQPSTKEEAIQTAKWLLANNYNIDMGLGQVNSTNMRKTNLSIEDAFDPCKNIAAAAKILQWNYAAASRNEIAATVAVDKSGVQGTTFSGQTHVDKLGDIDFFAGAAGTLNDKGQAANGSAWLNAAGPVLDADLAKFIPVAQLKADAQPNKDFGPGNISATAGTVINPDGTKNNLAVLLSGTLDGKNLNLTVNDSHDFAASNNVVLTPNLGITKDLLDGGTTVSGGVRAHNPHLFDKTTGGALELSGYGANLEKEPDYGVNLKGSVTFGNAQATSAATPLEAAFVNAVGKDKASATILTAALNPTEAETQKAPTAAPVSENVAAASSPATKNLDYNFLELSEKEQQKVLTLMAETYKTTHPDVSTKEAKSIILDELAAVKYHVDAHGTTSRKDDTPMNDGYKLHTEIPHDEIAHTQR